MATIYKEFFASGKTKRKLSHCYSTKLYSLHECRTTYSICTMGNAFFPLWEMCEKMIKMIVYINHFFA